MNEAFFNIVFPRAGYHPQVGTAVLVQEPAAHGMGSPKDVTDHGTKMLVTQGGNIPILFEVSHAGGLLGGKVNRGVIVVHYFHQVASRQVIERRASALLNTATVPT